MDTWALLCRELQYNGITLLNYTKCQIGDESGQVKAQGVIRTIRDINKSIKQQKKILLSLWNEAVFLLSKESYAAEILDERMVNLFLFSLKDMVKFLLCFEGAEKSKYYDIVFNSLNRDINSFSRQQIYNIPDYKISIDWVNRTICRLLYIANLLAFASMGTKRISKYDVKTARGISGPWAHLDLPMEERVFPFGDELQQRDKGKKGQRRYTKGLANYNNDGRVGEGHYWRELRNEPFSWFDRETEDPYPHRSLLNR